MKTFNDEEAPQTYRDFKKSVLHTIEGAEVESDEAYPGALFTVDREGNAEIIHLEDIAEDYEDDMPLETIVHEILPDIIRKNNSKYFAFVFSGEKTESEDSKEIVAVVSGDIFNTDMLSAEVNRKYHFAELEPWEKEQHESYSTLVAPLRQGITYQG